KSNGDGKTASSRRIPPPFSPIRPRRNSKPSRVASVAEVSTAVSTRSNSASLSVSERSTGAAFTTTFGSFPSPPPRRSTQRTIACVSGPGSSAIRSASPTALNRPAAASSSSSCSASASCHRVSTCRLSRNRTSPRASSAIPTTPPTHGSSSPCHPSALTTSRLHHLLRERFLPPGVHLQALPQPVEPASQLRDPYEHALQRLVEPGHRIRPHIQPEHPVLHPPRGRLQPDEQLRRVLPQPLHLRTELRADPP